LGPDPGTTGDCPKMQTALTILAKLKNIPNNPAARGIIGSMILKIASAVVAFGLFSLAANAAGPEEFGRFSIFFSILYILSIVAAGGQELQIVRSWNEYITHKKPALALGALRYGWMVSLGGALIVSMALGGFLLLDSDLTPLRINGEWLLVVASVAFLATNTVSLYSMHVARAVVGIRMGDAQYELTWRIVAIIFLAGCMIVGHAPTTMEILFVFAFGLMLVLTIQIVAVSRRVALEVGKIKPAYAVAEWTPRSIRIWLSAIMESANQHMEVFLIGLLLDPLAAGAYFVASRLSNAFALAASGLYTFGTRRIPSLYFGGKTAELKHTLNLMAIMSLIIVVGGMAAVLVAGDYMLMIFGPEYRDYYWVFVILSIGTAATAANGPVPSLLMLTGHEGRYMNIVTISVAYRIVGYLIFVPLYGIVGAAVVTTIVMIGITIILNYLSRSLTGMDVSIMRLVVDSPDSAEACKDATTGNDRGNDTGNDKDTDTGTGTGAGTDRKGTRQSPPNPAPVLQAQGHSKPTIGLSNAQ
jgi:O-antigen/teichoic acid export membrane protein